MNVVDTAAVDATHPLAAKWIQAAGQVGLPTAADYNTDQYHVFGPQQVCCCVVVGRAQWSWSPVPFVMWACRATARMDGGTPWRQHTYARTRVLAMATRAPPLPAPAAPLSAAPT